MRGTSGHVHNMLLLLLITALSMYWACVASGAAAATSTVCRVSDCEVTERLAKQLASATAVNKALKERLLRQQHHTPIPIAYPFSGIPAWQLLCAVLLMCCVGCAYQMHRSRSQCHRLQHTIQQLKQQLCETGAVQDHYNLFRAQQEQQHAAWAAVLRDVVCLIKQRAATLAAQEDLLSKAVALESGSAEQPATGPHAPEKTPHITQVALEVQAVSQRVTLGQAKAAETEGADSGAQQSDVQHNPDNNSKCCLQQVQNAGNVSADIAKSVNVTAGADWTRCVSHSVNASYMQPAEHEAYAASIHHSLQSLHCYMQSSCKNKIAGLHQLEQFVEQLQADMAAKAVKQQEMLLLSQQSRLRDTPYSWREQYNKAAGDGHELHVEGSRVVRKLELHGSAAEQLQRIDGQQQQQRGRKKKRWFDKLQLWFSNPKQGKLSGNKEKQTTSAKV